MNLQTVKISDIKPNPNNPRIIKDDKFKKLVKSIQDFPEMLTLRPIVVDDDMVVLGGNMRLKALQHLKYMEVPIIKASQLTDEQKKEFIIKDNVGYGEWDYDALANEWDTGLLGEWGLDVPTWKDYSEENQEIDVSDFEEEGKIVLKFPAEQYEEVLEILAEKRKELNLAENAQVMYYLLTNNSNE